MTDTIAARPEADPSTTRESLSRGGALGAVIALVTNLGLLAVGNLGTPVQVVKGDDPASDLSVAEVVIVTVIAVVVATLALWIFARRRNGFRTWAVLVLGVAVVSVVPLFGLDLDTASQITLATMHLAVGMGVVAGQVLSRR